MTATLAAWALALILPTIPGAVDPHVTQATIHRTVCVPGYTRRVRPSSSYTTALKKRQVVALGYANQNYHAYEEDHLVPLELGGSPRSPRNLWPEPWAQALRSDRFEDELHYRLCRGDLSLRYARALAIDWKRLHG